MAEEVGLDLVEIAPLSRPPVCKVMDYGKYRYQQSKKEHDARQRQKGTQLKEVKLRLFTGEHDLKFKIQHIRDFLEGGHKVKVTMMLKGRERAFQPRGQELMVGVSEQLQGVGQLESAPRMEGNSIGMMLIPKVIRKEKK